jgi:integrase
MRVAILEGWRKDNPVLAVKGVKIKSKGHRTWTDEEIAAFEAHYPIGTEARLAFALLLYTGQRRSDVVRMGRQHVKDGVLTIAQKKGGETVEVSIPILLSCKLSSTTFKASALGPPSSSQHGASRAPRPASPIGFMTSELERDCRRD